MIGRYWLSVIGLLGPPVTPCPVPCVVTDTTGHYPNGSSSLNVYLSRSGYGKPFFIVFENGPEFTNIQAINPRREAHTNGLQHVWHVVRRYVITNKLHGKS